jgi:voltage-gated potassium channel
MVTQPYKKFIWSGIALIGLLAIGTIGYWFIGDKHYSFIDTLYMTVITVTTIGFTEVVDLSANPGGRVFTIFVAIAGIGIMGYVATNITVLLLEGQLTDSFKRRRMENIARRLKDHYIVCGAGNIGTHVIGELVSTKRSHIVVDPDRKRINRAMAIFKNGVFIEGDATDNSTLVKAGIDQAKGLFAVMGDDNVNLVICLSAKQLNPKLRIVSECRDVNNEEKMKRVGADSIVSPSYIGGLRMASEMVRPTVTSFLDIMMRDRDKNLRVEEITIPAQYPEKSLAGSRLKSFAHSLLLAVKEGDGWLYNPPDNYVIKPGRNLVFMTTPEGRMELEELIQKS